MMRSFAPPGAPALLTILPLISVGFSGACFGFFFAWQSSTLRGLDMIDPGHGHRGHAGDERLCP